MTKAGAVQPHPLSLGFADRLPARATHPIWDERRASAGVTPDWVTLQPATCRRRGTRANLLRIMLEMNQPNAVNNITLPICHRSSVVMLTEP